MPENTRPYLSWVIPTYNEKENIQETIPRIFAYLHEKKISAEVIVVDDNSPDGTGEAVKELAKKYSSLKLLTPAEKKGIGHALAEGYRASKGELILSMDADLEFQPRVIEQFLEKINQGCDFVVASKYHPQTILVRKTLHEKIQTLISQSGALYMNVITQTPVHDFSMNFRILKRKVWEDISPTDTKNFFLAECLFQAHQKGYVLGEVPFTFNQRKFGASKTNLWGQTATFLTRVWKYRFWGRSTK